MTAENTGGKYTTPTFESLGIKPLINCRGTFTDLGGSRELEVVRDAVRRASLHHVDLNVLNSKVGERLHELTGAEWGYISSGCAAALCQITAACVAGGDPEKILRLPVIVGPRDEVIMQKAHRSYYDQAIRMAGARIIEVETEAQLRSAVCERTAMVAVRGDRGHLGQIPVERMIKIAREQGVPCVVDAAAERPDVPNVYLQMGAEAVVYSGGKCLRGPQASGLVLGDKELLSTACLNASPHHSIGRPMKASKENIMGLLAAVEAWIHGRNHQQEWKAWEGYLEGIQTQIADLSDVHSKVCYPGVSNVSPSLLVSWDTEMFGFSYADACRALEDGEPGVAVRLLAEGILITAYTMEDGEDAVVGRRLREMLSAMQRKGQHCAYAGVSSSNVAGIWQVEIEYVMGGSTGTLALKNKDNTVDGQYRTEFSSGTVAGHFSQNEVQLHAEVSCEGNVIEYVFRGEVVGTTMSGVVELGEYGHGKWSARRVDET